MVNELGEIWLDRSSGLYDKQYYSNKGTSFESQGTAWYSYITYKSHSVDLAKNIYCIFIMINHKHVNLNSFPNSSQIRSQLSISTTL